MEKSDKKRILTRVLIVIAALTLLSCCFLGSTFAKYVTNETGTAQVGVAKWDIDVEVPAASGGTSAVTVNTGKLSPDDTVYDQATHATKPRFHTSDKFLVAIVTNNSDVKATITVSAGTSADCNVIEEPATGADNYNDFTKTEAVKCFSIKFYTSDTNSAAAATEELASETLDAKTDSATDAIYIFAEVTWTSQDTAEKSGDALDTWIGQYVTSVSWTLTYSAVQDSELPTTTTPVP